MMVLKMLLKPNLVNINLQTLMAKNRLDECVLAFAGSESCYLWKPEWPNFFTLLLSAG